MSCFCSTFSPLKSSLAVVFDGVGEGPTGLSAAAVSVGVGENGMDKSFNNLVLGSPWECEYWRVCCW